MELLGDKNWYFPSWLEWLPKISIEGNHEEQPATEPAAQPAAGD
jgi:RND superfamily putative drug exporter